MANSVDPDQTAPICSGSTLFASILNLSVILAIICSRRLQQTTFSDAFFLGALRVNILMEYSTRFNWVILHVFLSSADFFENQLFRKILSTIRSVSKLFAKATFISRRQLKILRCII